jgi:hypothetical protein
MKRYEIPLRDFHLFENKSEVIVHFPDFYFAEKKLKSLFVSCGENEISMQVIGMGNQNGSLVIRLSTEDSLGFSRLSQAMYDEKIFVSG